MNKPCFEPLEFTRTAPFPTSRMTTPQKNPLICGDAIVGFVVITGSDFPWTLGDFIPGPGYADYAAFFERERELDEIARADDSNDMTAHDSWLNALAAINGLKLSIKGSLIQDFKIDSYGKCEFRFDPSASLQVRKPLLNSRMHDGSRHFAELPEVCSWDTLRQHITRLGGAAVTRYLTDDVTEMWLDFSFRGHAFTVNNQSGDFWFFVRDPACADEILLSVVDHCEPLLPSRQP
jgi:hypothetical protein